MDIDTQIERALNLEADRAVVAPELMRTVLRRARLRRVRNVGLAMLGIAVMVAVVTVASQTFVPSKLPTPAGRTPGVIPWVNRPAPPYQPSPIPSPIYPTARPCRATDLRVVRTSVGAATGNVYLGISLRNESPSSCELRGYPTVLGLSPDSLPTPLRAGHLGPDFGPTAAALPGAVVGVFVSTDDACGSRTSYPALRLVPPSGGHFDIDIPQGFEFGCRVNVGRFGVPSLAPKVRDETSPLRITAQLPATATASSTLRYTVRITNTGDLPFLLRPCPSYEESIVVGAPSGEGTARRDYYLNCNSLGAIDPHRTVTYAMAINVPNLPGYAKFLWQLHVPEIPSGGGTLQVVPPEPSP